MDDESFSRGMNSVRRGIGRCVNHMRIGVTINGNVHSVSFILWDLMLGTDTERNLGGLLWSCRRQRSGTNQRPVIEAILRSNERCLLDVNLDRYLRTGLINVDRKRLEPEVRAFSRDVEHVALGLIIALVQAGLEN